MLWLIIGIFLFLIIFLWVVKNSGSADSSPYQLKGVLFTPAERSFLGVLNSVLKDDVHIMGKVRVADVITPSKSRNKSN